MYTQLQSERDNAEHAEERIQKLVLQKADFESQLKELEEKLAEEEIASNDIISKKKKLENENGDLKKVDLSIN